VSQREVREVALVISHEELEGMIRAITGADIKVERTYLEPAAGGENLVLRVSHIRAPITSNGGVLPRVRLRALEEDYGGPA